MTFGIPDVASGERGAENALEAPFKFQNIGPEVDKYLNRIRNLSKPPKVSHF
jgi:hypothetical protein